MRHIKESRNSEMKCKNCGHSRRWHLYSFSGDPIEFPDTCYYWYQADIFDFPEICMCQNYQEKRNRREGTELRYNVKCSCGWYSLNYTEEELRGYYGENWNKPELWDNADPDNHKFTLILKVVGE